MQTAEPYASAEYVRLIDTNVRPGFLPQHLYMYLIVRGYIVTSIWTETSSVFFKWGLPTWEGVIHELK